MSDDLITVFPEMDHCDTSADMEAMIATLEKVLPDQMMETISPQIMIGRPTRKGREK